MTGVEVHDTGTAVDAGRWFTDRGVTVAVITLGAKGAVVVRRDQARVLESFPVEVGRHHRRRRRVHRSLGRGARGRPGSGRRPQPGHGGRRVGRDRPRSQPQPADRSRRRRVPRRPRMILVAALAPSLDLTYTVDGLQLGAIHRTDPPLAVGGGKGLNMARAAVTMGARCRVVALLGGWTGRRIADLLDAEGLDLVTVDSGAETRTCVSVADRSRNDLTELYAGMPQLASEALVDFANAVSTALQGRPAGCPSRVALLVRPPTRWPSWSPRDTRRSARWRSTRTARR